MPAPTIGSKTGHRRATARRGETAERDGDIPLLASGVVLLGLVGVATTAAPGAGESGGAAVDVGERAYGGAAGRLLLPAVG
jgi:hypothetical protein